MTNIDEFFTIFFDEIFVKGFDDFYLLTIARFRIGVPSILFFIYLLFKKMQVTD